MNVTLDRMPMLHAKKSYAAWLFSGSLFVWFTGISAPQSRFSGPCAGRWAYTTCLSLVCKLTHYNYTTTVQSYYHNHRTWPMRCKKVKAREELDIGYCQSAMTLDKVVNAAMIYPMSPPVVHHRRSLRSTVMCDSSPILSIIMRDFVEVSHDHTVFCSIDHNNDGA